MASKNTVDETEEALIQKAKDCLDNYLDRESDNIRRAEEAIRFRAGEQWPQMIRRDRENEHQDGGSRPCPVLDKTDQFVRQIVNEERINRAAIKIRPVDDYSDPKTAEILTGIIRHIEDQSEALVAYTTAGEHAIDGGFGYFRVLAEYTDSMSFNQDILIKRIHNRFSVALGRHTESDASDMNEALIWEDIDREEFKLEYPKAKEVDFYSNGDKDNSWSDKDTIRIAEYYVIKNDEINIHRLDTGEIFTDDDYNKLIVLAEKEGIDTPNLVESRKSTVKRIKWYKITSEEIIEEADIVGSYIPIIKVTGNEITMPDGKIKLSGVIDSAMDAQRLHNYAHAGFIEHVALAPRAPWVAEEEQIEGYEDEYANANRKPIAVLKYKSVAIDGHLLPAPQRTPPPGMSTGWQQIINNTEQGISAAFGMYGPSIGATSQEKSGIALKEQKAQGAVGQFHLPDNLSRSIQHCGRILLEWIPEYYDTAEVARVLGEDGEQKIVKLDPNQQESVMAETDEFNKEVGEIYNLTLGKYDVTVSTGPSYTAKRQEAVDTQTQIIQAAPELMQVMGDILFSNMDAPGSDKISKRLKTMLPPEIQQLDDEENKKIDPQTQVAMTQVEQAAQQIEEKGQQLAEIEKKIQAKAQEVGTDQTQVESALKELDAQKKIFMADAKTAQAKLELVGMKLIDQLEDVTGPLMNQLSQQTKEVQSEDENGEPETIVVQDPAMQELLQSIAIMTSEATAQMAQTVNDALITVSQAVSAPRETIIRRDDQGNPIGSVSVPQTIQ